MVHSGSLPPAGISRLLISGIRQANIEEGHSNITSSALGKWKLGWQITALVSLLLLRDGSLLFPIALISLWIALVLAFVSAYGYLGSFLVKVRESL